jgi:hypothetical protein
VARVAFEPGPFLRDIAGRIVFCPRKDVLLLHLSHPMFQRALSALTRRRFPGTGDDVSRWTVRVGGVPSGADAVLLLTVEELAVNELRESFHHWVRTLAFPIRKGELGGLVDHRTATAWRESLPANGNGLLERARALLDDVEPQVQEALKSHAQRLTESLRGELLKGGEAARKQEDERYRSRQGEVSSLIAENTLARLSREIDRLKLERAQGLLFEEASRLDAIDRSIEEKQGEIARRTRHYEEVRAQLERERERILKHLLPRRHAMVGSAQAFPVAIELRLPPVGT